MGLRGPVAKSAEQRTYEGGAAHRPLPAARPQYPDGAPERPKGMTAAARRIWDAYIDQMAPSGILRPVDAFALQRLCEDAALLQELQAGMRQLAGEKERERKKRLKAVRDQVARLAAEGKLLESIDELRAEESRLMAEKSEGNALIALAMSHEGRRLTASINSLAGRICRQELQFGLTPVSAQRLEGASVIPAASSNESSIEAALC